MLATYRITIITHKGTLVTCGIILVTRRVSHVARRVSYPEYADDNFLKGAGSGLVFPGKRGIKNGTNGHPPLTNTMQSYPGSGGFTNCKGDKDSWKEFCGPSPACV
jgi:hypothetical protein